MSIADGFGESKGRSMKFGGWRKGFSSDLKNYSSTTSHDDESKASEKMSAEDR